LHEIYSHAAFVNYTYKIARDSDCVSATMATIEVCHAVDEEG
jgi:hypothetical protein